jgi:hypothetical protein
MKGKEGKFFLYYMLWFGYEISLQNSWVEDLVPSEMFTGEGFWKVIGSLVRTLTCPVG